MKVIGYLVIAILKHDCHYIIYIIIYCYRNMNATIIDYIMGNGI